jgi:hypothetical protein
MPEDEEYPMILEENGKIHFNIERLEALMYNKRLASIITTDGETVLCEIWPPADSGGEFMITPFAKLLTKEEIEAMTAIPL